MSFEALDRKRVPCNIEYESCYQKVVFVAHCTAHHRSRDPSTTGSRVFNILKLSRLSEEERHETTHIKEQD